jgi:hypothetical protein
VDEERFDHLARALGRRLPRRHVALLASGILRGLRVGALGLLGSRPGEASAKNKRPCPPCKTRKKGKCKGLLPDGAACAGGTCQGGSCVAPPLSCPQGQRLCGGACLSVLICCNDADCAGGRTCQQGTCACPADRPHVCAGSTICQQCCSVAECRPDSRNDGQLCQDGVCVCTVANTRRCPNGTGWAGYCGSCCDSSECPGAEICYAGNEPQHCDCHTGTVCEGVCVPFTCVAQCTSSCPAGVPLGGSCCGDGALTCQEEGGPGGPRRCLPPV